MHSHTTFFRDVRKKAGVQHPARVRCHLFPALKVHRVTQWSSVLFAVLQSRHCVHGLRRLVGQASGDLVLTYLTTHSDFFQLASQELV